MDLNQVTIPCKNYEESVAFYTQLGLRQIVDSPPRYARFETEAGTTLSIHKVEFSEAQSGVVVYFEVEDVDETVERLRGVGVNFEREPCDQDWLWREAYLRDPYGNRICIYHAGDNRRYPPWRVDDQMKQFGKLEQIFKLLRRGEIPEREILDFFECLGPEDVTWIMEYVETLSGPQDYMDDLDECDDNDNVKGEIIVKGFFHFIDLVSLLILKLGDDAIEEAKRFKDSSSHYVPYVLKYCIEQRFAKGISEPFPFLKI